MKPYIIIATLVTVIAGALFIGGCNYGRVDDIKAHATQAWIGSGFEVVGYEGYQIGDIFGRPGGKVWYIVRRPENPSIHYHGFLSRWGSEYQIYDLSALDAIGPK